VPTYQYACTECGDQHEVVQSFSDDPLTVCGACGGRLRKVFSPVGIVFKGSGFYRTDSRADAKRGTAAAANGKSGGEGADSSGKSESGAKAESGAKSGSDGSGSSAASGSSGSSGSSGAESGSSGGKSGSKGAGTGSSGTSSKVA
jgi:putative FmdB family regulatory protein